MGHYPVYPSGFDRAEFSRVRFTLEMVSGCPLAPGSLLDLRRPLMQAAGKALGPHAVSLFDLPPSPDRQAMRRYQKPAPGFVVHATAKNGTELLEGDRVEFELLLLGTTIPFLDDFAVILRQFGDSGLARGEGRFEISTVSFCGCEGAWQTVRPDRPFEPLLIRLDHWLDAVWPERTPVALEFLAPLRLLSGNRVLRQPRFDQLFPFLLRRATSLLHAHCGLEVVDEPAPLLQAARSSHGAWRNLRWCDWRETGRQEVVGGLLGSLEVDGPDLESILWVLLLATLFGAGKGAAYGAGRCRLRGQG
jgi:hypothetical protein